MLSDAGAAVRGPAVAEAIRLLDATFADGFRAQLQARTGDAALALRLVPEQPQEAYARERAALIAAMLGAPSDLLSGLPALGGGGSNNRGGGLLGRLLPSPPPDTRAALAQLQSRAAGAWPRLQHLAQNPAAAEVAATLQRGLAQRFAARTVKLIAGAWPQAAVAELPPAQVEAAEVLPQRV